MLLFAAITASSATKADNIIFKLRTFEGQGIAGRIDANIPDKDDPSKPRWVTVLPNLINADGSLPNWKCAPAGALFSAYAFDFTFYLDTPEKFKSCAAGEIVFRFRRKEYASALIKALDPNSDAIKEARAKGLQDKVIVALKNGQFSDAAKASLLLRDEVRNQSGTAAAEPFRILAYDISGAAVAGSQPLVFDSQQNKFVLSSETVNELAEFQKLQNIENSGKVDWATAKVLPNSFSAANAILKLH
jgi:hypothetical protein